MKLIPLTDARGQLQGHAQVDDDLYHSLLTMGRWYLHSEGYAACSIPGETSPETLLMHREVLPLRGVKPGARVSHRNKNRVDNRFENLRSATVQQTCAYSNRRRDNRSGFRGVSQIRSGRYTAYININRKQQSLGTFEKPEDAARAYDKAAREHYGEFAMLNFGQAS